MARLDQLAPAARPWFEALIRAMQADGYSPFIGQVHRSPAQQRQAIADGATSAHQVLSWHGLVAPDGTPASRAVDFRRRLLDGGEDPTTSGPDDFWRALYKHATAIPGMRSLAYRADGSKLLLNGKTWDAGHVEFRAPYATLLAAVQAESPHLLTA